MGSTVAEKAGDYWVVNVDDVPDIENRMPGYNKRFIFEGEDAALQAWACVAKAEKAGFEVRIEKARKFDSSTHRVDIIPRDGS